jgi:hypothetical protein
MSTFIQPREQPIDPPEPTKLEVAHQDWAEARDNDWDKSWKRYVEDEDIDEYCKGNDKLQAEMAKKPQKTIAALKEACKAIGEDYDWSALWGIVTDRHEKEMRSDWDDENPEPGVDPR